MLPAMDRSLTRPTISPFSILKARASGLENAPEMMLPCPEAEQIFDQDTLVDAGEDVFQRGLAGLDDKVGERWFGRVEQAARGVAGRGDPGLGGCLQVVDKTLEHSLLDQHIAAVRDAFVVVGCAGEFPIHRPIIQEGDLLVEEFFADLALDRASALVDFLAVQSPG